jgi:DNA-binding transcriptional MocR family regulator
MHQPGLHKLGPSLLSLDTDGRVVRLETFSKAFAPNFRLSLVAGHPNVIDAIILANEISFQQPAGASQAIILEARREGAGERGRGGSGPGHAFASSVIDEASARRL